MEIQILYLFVSKVVVAFTKCSVGCFIMLWYLDGPMLVDKTLRDVEGGGGVGERVCRAEEKGETVCDRVIVPALSTCQTH